VGAILVAGPIMLIAGASAESIGRNDVNIRSGPSLDSPVLFRAPLGYPIQILKQQGNWVYFRDWQDETGWVDKPMVSDIDTAVIRVNRANVRSGPGLDHPVVGEAEMGEIYKVLGKTGDWVHLALYLSNDRVGWVRSDLVFGAASDAHVSAISRRRHRPA
jgi:uncharacterized protein YgiM (DUF1202 family)